MNKRVLFLLFCILCCNISAQLKTIDSLTFQAKKLYDNEKYNEVIDFVNQTKHNFKKELALDSLNYAFLLFHKSNSHYYLKNYLKSINNLNTVINLSPSSKKGLVLKGKAYYEKAFSQYALQDYFESATSLKIAESILSKSSITDKAYLLNIYAELGADLSYLGNYKEALFYLNKGLSFLNKLSKKDKLPRSKTYYATNLHFKYIETYHNGLIPNSRFKSLKVENLIKHLKQIKLLRLKPDFTSQEEHKYVFSLILIGDFFINGKDKCEPENIKNAHNYFDSALSLLDQKKHPDAYVELLFNRSKAYLYEKNHLKALKSIDKIFSLIDDNDNRKSFFYAQKGRVYLDEGKKEEAKKEFFKMASEIHSDTIPLLKSVENFKPSNVLNESELLSGIADESININKALIKDLGYLYKIALIQFKHNYKASPFNFKLKSYYEKAKSGVLRTCNFDNRFEAKSLLENIENIENILSVKEFLNNRKQADIGIPNEVLKKEIALRLQLTNSIGVKSENAVYTAKKELNDYLREIEEKYPTLSKKMFFKFSIQQFQKELPSNTIALRYIKSKDFYYCFVIDKKEIKKINLDKVKDLDSIVNSYLKIIKNKKEDKTLGTLILKKLLPNIQLSNQRLIIVSDGKLRNLPFETLVNNGKYLIQNHKISYASYLALAKDVSENKVTLKGDDKVTFLAFTPSYNLKPDKNKERVKLVNYNLGGAKKESEILTKLFNGRNICNDSATKKKFIKESKNAKILHLSMHADIDNKQPELSHLLFTGNDSISNGKMYIEELCGLNLNAKIAVLSACNTGVGNETIDNKGVVSLHNAFTYSGVPATLSSLWKIPDKATKQIMVSFYKNIKLGHDKSEALQKAKIDYINTVNDSNLDKPYFWGGFVLYGDYEPINFSSKKNNLYIYLLIIVFSGCYAFIKKVK